MSDQIVSESFFIVRLLSECCTPVRFDENYRIDDDYGIEDNKCDKERIEKVEWKWM